MKDRKPALAVIVLILSAMVLAAKLLAPRTIQVFIEGGQVVSLGEEGYFTFADALLLTVSAWVGGMAALYLFQTGREEEGRKDGRVVPLALKMLAGDEKKVYQHIVDVGGETFQKTLVIETGFDKAKVTRLLDKLEKKGLIVKIRHGMTNRIVLKRE